MENNIKEQNQISITPEFYQLLKQYTNSNDPLEDPNFDIASYLNEKFPDFKSLEKLPELIDDFDRQIGELDEEIDGLMCERATYNEELKNYMNELNNDVGKIIELINTIKQKTDTNETTVKLICNDIKNLDNARNNITTTISSLTKLIMLITGIEKLETFVKEKLYKEAANAIAASNDIMDYFKDYKHVTQVNNLYQKKDALCGQLLSSILDEFKNNIGELPKNSDKLYDACLAINAIGDNAIITLKTWFTQYKLTPYENAYSPNNEKPVEFKDTERRFEWLKRCLKDYDKLYDEIFPPSWGFKSQLCQEFCRITKIHLNDMFLKNIDGIIHIDVESLVMVLNKTINFEKHLHEYLLAEFPGQILDKNNQKINLEKLSENTNPQDIVDELMIKYNINNKQRNPNRKDPNEKPKYRPFRVLGVISESFEPYMQSYVNNEEEKIKQTIIDLQSKDRIEGKLYVSSLYLFNNIKQAMNRCLSFSKGKTFLDLCDKFSDIFKYYNDNILKNKFNLNFYQKKENTNKNLKDEDITVIAYIINTCDYCISTIGSLTISLKEKIEEKFEDEINYDNVIDNIREIYKNAYDLLSNNIKISINDILQSNFLKKNWVLGNNENIEANSYVFSISKVLEKTFILIKDILQEEFICHFLNIIPKIILENLMSYIYKVKKIDENGAQQLLTDIGELKNNILNLYFIVIKQDPGQSKENDSRYICLNMIIKKEFSKIESRLKCLGSVVMEIGNAYKTFVEDKSKEDFDKLIMLRGIKKNEITDYEKIFI